MILNTQTPEAAAPKAEVRAPSTPVSPDFSRIRELELSQLTPLKGQPRRHFDDATLQELAQSIRSYGILQPLIVSHNGNGLFTIIAGERRWRASHIAGLTHVPCLVRSPSEHNSLELALIENIQREELSPLDEARALEKLIADHEYSQETLAAKIGKERSTVTNALRLLSLPPEIIADLENKNLTAGHARALCGIEDKRSLVRLRDIVHKKKLSVRQTEELVKRYKKGQLSPQTLKNTLPADLRQLCDQFKGHLGTKVRIAGNAERGSIEISYYTQEDLNRVSDLILGAGLDGILPPR
jgi:ParB family chromosome partitioning protein